MPSPVRNCIKPGEVRNPKGKNQYTYRRDFERWFAEECKSRGRAGMTALFDQWEEGESRAQQFVMERAMPAVQKHEVDIPGADPSALAARLTPLAPKRRTNGADRSDDPPGEDRPE